MMPVCFQPVVFTKTTKTPHKFRYISPVVLHYSIDTVRLLEILQSVLKKNCGFNVIGFNKSANEFCGKKLKKSVNKLQVTLSIISNNYSGTFIKITPEVGEDVEINNFISKIKNVLQIYEK